MPVRHDPSLWSQPGVPHRGWILVDVEDHEEPDHTCELCGVAEVRYVHEIEHPDYPTSLFVGCICCEHATGDYANPRRLERLARNRTARLRKFLDREWRVSRAGNEFLNLKGRNVGVCPSFFDPGRFHWRIEGKFSPVAYDDPGKAKAALFAELNP